MLGYNIYQYFINIEGWSDIVPAESAPYDISVSPGTAVSLSALDSSKTYTHTVDSFTQTNDSGTQEDISGSAGGNAASSAWLSTGLIIGDDGSITGTSSSTADIDGVFAFQFTETPDAGATPAATTTEPKYLKIKITPGNTNNIGISDDSSDPTAVAAAIVAAGGSGSCSSGQAIDDEVNPCAPTINERDQERISELLGTCNASDGSAIRGLAPPSLQTAVDNAQAEVNRAQADYDSAYFFNGGEKEALDKAKADLVKAMENKEQGTPPVTKRLCDEKGGTWVPSPAEDTAQNACTALQIRKAEIAARLEQARIELKDDPTILGAIENMWDNSTGPGQILNNIVDTAGGSAEAAQVLADVLNVDVSSLNMQSHSAQCTNLVTSVNTNELRITSDNASCSSSRISERINTEGGSFNPEAYESPGQITVSDINQTITGTNSASCILDSVLNSNTNQTSTIDNSAAMGAIQNMTGGGKINSDPNACVDIDVTQSACSYIKDKQCCHNEISNTRTNILEIGGECPNILAQNITQLVDVSAIAECHMDDEATTDATTTGNTTVNPDSSSDQTMTPNYVMYIVLGLIVIAGLFIAGYIIYLRTGGGKAEILEKVTSSSKSTPASPPSEP